MWWPIYIFAGIVVTMFADWAMQLDFRRKKVSVGTTMCWIIGVALPPLSLFVGLITLTIWLVSPEGQGRVLDHTWPDWWGRARYRQHRALRWLWYLGRPPTKEDWLNGWSNVPARWKHD